MSARTLLCLCAGLLCLAAWAPAPAGAQGLQLEGLEVAFEPEPGGPPAMLAGSHPHALRVNLAVATEEDPELGEIPTGAVKDLVIEQPEGLVGDPTAAGRCPSAVFLAGPQNCALDTVVGKTEVEVGLDGPEAWPSPVINLTPPPGTVLKLGFAVLGAVVTIEAGLKDTPPYNPVVRVLNVSQALNFYASETVVWGVPADPSHDKERGICFVTEAPDSCPLGSPPERPFLTMPRSCTGPLESTFRARSWQQPGEWVAPPPVLTPTGAIDCPSLGFSPELALRPSTDAASSPSGLHSELTVEDPGIADPEGRAASDIEDVRVELPEGMTLNPSQAEGLGACSEAELDRERIGTAFGRGCPASSKLGTIEATTPILEAKTLTGQLFLAEPYENPFDSLIAIYLVIRDRDLGVMVKQAGRVDPGPRDGRLIATFPDLPQLPLGEVRLRLREGARSPLVTPDACGGHESRAVFDPWAEPLSDHVSESSFEIDRGPPGQRCPSGAPPFAPGFAAGSLSNAAGAHSPAFMRLTRADGHQDLTRFSATLPAGLTARLAGVPFCPPGAPAAARAKSGRAELASPSCPPASRIGGVVAGAGVGSQLTYVPGSLYLSGPYNGAPLSVIAIVPAVAGPFDVGTVVTRVALRVDPRSARASVDGAASDPIPHILAGIPLKVRDIRVHVERPGFALNPTSCAPKASQAWIWGGGADPFSSLDDRPVARTAPYQAAGCAALGFGPRLAFTLKGSPRRGGHPALRAVYRARPGQANLRRAALTFPRSAFVENAHFKTICTRVQYAAGPGGGALCPKGSVYGRARAWTPLLDRPLEGPVYLRSSENLLPDAVFALKGLIDAEATVRIDSVKGRLRATVQEAPDVPVSRVVVQMQGAGKGLFVNSRHLCKGPNRATARLIAHSNRRKAAKPRFRAPACKAKRRSKRR